MMYYCIRAAYANKLIE